jgi:hypothetical protein
MQDTIYQPSEKSILLALLDTEKLIDQYEHNLRGEILITRKEKDEQGKDIITQKWEPNNPPMMNTTGITRTMSYLRVICDKSISMTDLTEEMADMLSLHNADAFWTFLNVNAMNFGLKDESQLNEAYYPVYDLIVSRFHSCVDGMMVNAIAKTTNVTESKSMNPEQNPLDQQRPGLLGIRWPKV